MSKLTYEETTEMIRSRERSYEDHDLKEVDEMVEEMAEHLQGRKEREAASKAIKQHKTDHKEQHT